VEVRFYEWLIESIANGWLGRLLLGIACLAFLATLGHALGLY
jgi:hypothetical protein